MARPTLRGLIRLRSTPRYAAAQGKGARACARWEALSRSLLQAAGDKKAASLARARGMPAPGWWRAKPRVQPMTGRRGQLPLLARESWLYQLHEEGPLRPPAESRRQLADSEYRLRPGTFFSSASPDVLPSLYTKAKVSMGQHGYRHMEGEHPRRSVHGREDYPVSGRKRATMLVESQKNVDYWLASIQQP